MGRNAKRTAGRIAGETIRFGGHVYTEGTLDDMVDGDFFGKFRAWRRGHADVTDRAAAFEQFMRGQGYPEFTAAAPPGSRSLNYPPGGPAMRCNRCRRPMEGTTACDGACECGGLIEAAPVSDREAFRTSVNINEERWIRQHSDPKALCADCKRPFPDGELSADEEAIAADPVALLGQPLGVDSYCRGCLARWRKGGPQGSAERRADYDRIARGVASRLARAERGGTPDEGDRAPRNPMLEEAVRHSEAIDAILDEPMDWRTGSPEDPKFNEPQKGPLKPLGPLSFGCAYCCCPAGDDGLCGECRYEYGE